jgi:hypothetical protein
VREDVCFAQFWARSVARWPVESIGLMARPQMDPQKADLHIGPSAETSTIRYFRLYRRFQWIEWNAVRWRSCSSLKLRPTSVDYTSAWRLLFEECWTTLASTLMS